MRLDIPKYSRSITREEIRANDYNLNIPRYVDSSEAAESLGYLRVHVWRNSGNRACRVKCVLESVSILEKGIICGRGRLCTARTEHLKAGYSGKRRRESFLQHYQDVFSDLGEKLDQALIERAEQLLFPKQKMK